MNAIPIGHSHLMKSNLQFQEALRIGTLLMKDGIDFMNAKCNNKHMLNIVYERRKISTFV